MMKKIALLLALLMLLCCAGCGEKEEGTSVETTGATEQTPTQAAEEAIDELCTMSESGKHEYVTTVMKEPTCTETGMMLTTCIACQLSEQIEMPAEPHNGTGVSCTEDSVCTICGELVDEAFGHQEEEGIGVCRYCGEDMSGEETEPQTTQPEEVETTEGTVAAEA